MVFRVKFLNSLSSCSPRSTQTQKYTERYDRESGKTIKGCLDRCGVVREMGWKNAFYSSIQNGDKMVKGTHEKILDIQLCNRLYLWDIYGERSYEI